MQLGIKSEHSLVFFYCSTSIILNYWGWSGCAMVLGQLPGPRRPTDLVYSMAMEPQ